MVSFLRLLSKLRVEDFTITCYEINKTVAVLSFQGERKIEAFPPHPGCTGRSAEPLAKNDTLSK